MRDDGADPKQPGIRLYRTRVKLGFHTDGADIIGLLCLKKEKKRGTKPDRELGLGLQ